MEDRVTVKTTLTQRLNLPSVMVVLWAIRRMAKGQNADRPQLVSTNAESKLVLDRAKQLARDGRADSEAVTELRALANGKRRTLCSAERASRFMGYHRELRQANLANRLLVAALNGPHVDAIPPADNERIETVEAFKALERDERWNRLTELEPRLRELEADVDAGRFGDIRRLPASVRTLKERTRATAQVGATEVHFSSDDPPPTQEEVQELRDHSRRILGLQMSVKRLLGPDSPHSDLLLGSQSALDFASAYLVHRDTPI
jgi:hypothetical protein